MLSKQGHLEQKNYIAVLALLTKKLKAPVAYVAGLPFCGDKGSNL
jgi:hypothetical protein